jgi:beta-mannosidase
MHCPRFLLVLLAAGAVSSVGACTATLPRGLTTFADEARARSSGTTSLAGMWSYHAGDMPVTAGIPNGLPTMPVPSNWYKEGLDRAGVVWFFREVELGARPVAAAVRFAAVDYAADVYWDGAPIGSHRGYFAPFVVPIPANATGRHVLAVRVDSPIETEQAWSLHKTLIKGVLAHHDTRPGGAWSPLGQDANTGGIWGDVDLLTARAGFVDDIKVTTEKLTATRARLRIAARVSRLQAPADMRFTVTGPTGAVVAEVDVSHVASDGEVIAHVDVANPQVWWPYDSGTPALHTVRAELGGADVVRARFGIRTVTRDTSNKIVINGEPTFLRGTNYIGSLYYASFGEAAIRRDLELMRAAHINAVRVHAHVASPAFYRLCDELGLMVWQDFPLQWGYDDSATFADEAARQAREMVDSLYDHPSIIHWSSMNEAPWSSDWMVWKYKDYDPDQNRLLARKVYEAIASADPSRPVEANAHPAEHAWSGWYEGKYEDFAKPTPHPIVTEFGAQAVPDLSTLSSFLEPAQLWPVTGKNLETWEYHGFQLRELREIAHVAPGENVEELISNTQAYQARLTQFAAENLRRQKWQPVNAIFQFMFVEHWASMSWGVVDYLRKPKSGYETLARAYQPILPMFARKPNAPNLAGYVVNDTRKAISNAWLFAWVGERALAPRRVDIPANDIAHFDTPFEMPKDDQVLRVALVDAAGTTIGTNVYNAAYFADRGPK